MARNNGLPRRMWSSLALEWACRVSEISKVPLKEIQKRAKVPENFFKKCLDKKFTATYEQYDRIRTVLQKIEVDFVPDMTPSSDPEDPRNKTPRQILEKYKTFGFKDPFESDDPNAYKRHCIRCDAYMGTYGSCEPPIGGIVFFSYGNYGTVLYDPMNGMENLELFLCDDCAKEKADAIFHRTKSDPPRTTTFLQEIYREAVHGYLCKKFREKHGER